MFLKFRYLMALSIIVATSSLIASEYTIDKSHSKVGFSIRHMFSNVSGKFNDYSGTIEFDSKNVGNSKGTFRVVASSIDTNEKKRDDHLRSPDFFDVAKYKELVFTVTKVESDGFFSSDSYKMHGILEIRGIKKPVTFKMKFTGEAKDPWGNTRAGFRAKTKIDRKDFGIVWNQALDSGGVLLGDEVEINIEIEAIKK